MKSSNWFKIIRVHWHREIFFNQTLGRYFAGLRLYSFWNYYRYKIHKQHIDTTTMLILQSVPMSLPVAHNRYSLHFNVFYVSNLAHYRIVHCYDLSSEVDMKFSVRVFDGHQMGDIHWRRRLFYNVTLIAFKLNLLLFYILFHEHEASFQGDDDQIYIESAENLRWHDHQSIHHISHHQMHDRNFLVLSRRKSMSQSLNISQLLSSFYLFLKSSQTSRDIVDEKEEWTTRNFIKNFIHFRYLTWSHWHNRIGK